MTVSSLQTRRTSRVLGKVAAGAMAAAALVGGLGSAAHADPVNSIVLVPQHSAIAGLDQKVDHIVVLLHVPRSLIDLRGYTGGQPVHDLTIYTRCVRPAGHPAYENYRDPLFKMDEVWTGTSEHYSMVGLSDTPADMPHEKFTSCSIQVLAKNPSIHAAEFARSTPVPMTDRPTTISAVFMLKPFAY
ncbi:MAG: hypothetical protein JWN46_358 [Acidimicrobiales bacterium]|nr:hypothetical protein [Acidimicrobiales bacterium]